MTAATLTTCDSSKGCDATRGGADAALGWSHFTIRTRRAPLDIQIAGLTPGATYMIDDPVSLESRTIEVDLCPEHALEVREMIGAPR